jgi:hypothetical protein
MHQNHDLDLIAAFAEGRPDDTAPAEALVAACAECAEIFRSHRIVLEAVQLQAPIAMSDLERHRLHASVWDSLQTGASSTATPAKKAARTPWWYRVVPVAAALVVVVGIGANLLSGGDTASGVFETVADTAGGPADAYRPLGADEEQADTAETSAGADALSTETTAAAAGETQLMAPDADLEEAAEDFQQRAVADAAEVADEARACVEADPAAEGTPVASESAIVEDTEVWLVGLGTPAEVSSVNIYAEADCDVLYRGEDPSAE